MKGLIESARDFLMAIGGSPPFVTSAGRDVTSLAAFIELKAAAEEAVKHPTMGKNDENMGWAIDQMRFGQRVAREGWNGPGQYLMLQNPDEHSKMTLSYIYITTVQGDLVPWVASQTDILAHDWLIVH